MDGLVTLQNAALTVDAPQMSWFRVASTISWLRHGYDGDPPEVALARDGHGRVVGAVQVMLPRWDNAHLATLEVTVDPGYRRRGLGRRLFALGERRVRDHGRSVLTLVGFDTPAANAFAKATGMEFAYQEVYRRQDLTGLDWDRLDREYAKASSHATGYDLLRLPGAVPEEFVDEVVRMTAAINDAPTGDLAIEDEVFSAERIRAFETALSARGARSYRLVARERATGVFAGHTMVEVVPEAPWCAGQLDTSVLKAHRGHRLGLLLKLGALYWLREEEPQLRAVDTSNAVTNAHMIGINEAIGHRVVASSFEWQRRLD